MSEPDPTVTVDDDGTIRYEGSPIGKVTYLPRRPGAQAAAVEILQAALALRAAPQDTAPYSEGDAVVLLNRTTCWVREVNAEKRQVYLGDQGWWDYDDVRLAAASPVADEAPPESAWDELKAKREVAETLGADDIAMHDRGENFVNRFMAQALFLDGDGIDGSWRPTRRLALASLRDGRTAPPVAPPEGGRRWRKRPIEVDAMQVPTTDDPFAWGQLVGWMHGTDLEVAPEGLRFHVEQGDSWCIARFGDWIIAEPGGHGHYPCTAADFAIGYEEAALREAPGLRDDEGTEEGR
jgi:hypothetical protein